MANISLLSNIQADSLFIDASLERIASSLKKSKDHDRVTINHNSGALIVKVCNVFWHYISYALSSIIPKISIFYPEKFKKENRETIDELRKLVGSQRLSEMCSRYHIDIDGKYKHGDSLARRHIENIICGIGDVRIEDLKHLFVEIKSGDAPIRHLSADTSEYVREYFSAHSSLETIDKEGVDLLYEILVPASKIETLFLNNLPKISSWMLREVKSRVYLTEMMRRHDWSTSKYPHIDCVTLLQKRILNHDLPDGIVVPFHNGYYFLLEKVIKGGGHCLFMKTVTRPKPENDYCSMPCLLSTRAYIVDWQKYLSFIGMFENNLGASPTKALYQDIYNRVTDPNCNFVRTKDETLHISGFSQGGTQVQRLLTTDALFNRFKKTYLLSCPGIEEANYKHYKRLTDQLPVKDPDSQLELHYVTHFGDHIFDVGEGHIGVDVNPSKVKVVLHEVNLKKAVQKEKEHRDLYRPASPDSFWIFLTLRDSLKKHHSTTPLFDTGYSPDDFSHRVFTNQTAVGNKTIQKILNMGRDLLRKHIEEIWRKWTAYGKPRDWEAFRKKVSA